MPVAQRTFMKRRMVSTGRVASPCIHVICIDDALMKNNDMILARWAEYLLSLPNVVHATNPCSLYDLPILPIIQKLHYPPSFHDVEMAIFSFKSNIAADPSNTPARIIGHSLYALHKRLYNFILDCKSAKCLPH